MLADPKSADLIANFTGQWLSVRGLRTIDPAINLFPDFDDNLRAAFQREVELFFESVVREDRSVIDLLDADYTFVNERLAKHYGIQNVYGPQFRRYTLPNGARHAPRPARQGRAAGRDVEPDADVAGDARQVGAGDAARRRAAAAAAGRRGEHRARQRQHRQRAAADHARGAGEAPHQPDVLGVPPDLRAGRHRARELRRRRRVADD